MKPLCIDLFCGLGGWAEGFLSEGYDVIGFDIERHDYGTGGYPGQKETMGNPVNGVKWGGCNGKRFDERPKGNVAAHREGTKQPGISGTRNNGMGDRWFQDGAATHGSKSNARKAASAQIAKIPFPLASHIARVFKGEG